MAAVLLLVLVSISAQSAADSNIAQQIEQLGSKNEQTVKSAVDALTRQGPQVVPALVDALDKRKECQMQFVASGVLRRIDPAHNGIETALATLARGECSGNSKQDFIFKQEAAFALSRSRSGLERLSNMVPHPDLATRRRVAFAFEDLTEKFDSPLEPARPPAALIEPTARALPKLAPFLDARDEMLRCVTLEAMEQASASRHPSIAAAAKTVMEGKKVSCGRQPSAVSGGSGLRLLVAEENTDPELRIVLPDRPASDRAIRILFPEHVTAVRHGDATAEQLYMYRPGRNDQRPDWRADGRSLEYERTLGRGVRLRARATLEDDGVRFRYEFSNKTADAFDMITAVTDPRLTALFLDERLERTYVHHANGFDLLASETPNRLTLPLSEWLPVRYLASFRWPVPAQRIERRPDGITYIHKSRAVDEPFIATRSSDGVWIVASFARDPGNVWSNPALTCQHVDPQTTLGAGQQATVEMKMLILRASLEEALKVARAQRGSLQ